MILHQRHYFFFFYLTVPKPLNDRTTSGFLLPLLKYEIQSRTYSLLGFLNLLRPCQRRESQLEKHRGESCVRIKYQTSGGRTSLVVILQNKFGNLVYTVCLPLISIERHFLVFFFFLVCISYHSDKCSSDKTYTDVSGHGCNTGFPSSSILLTKQHFYHTFHGKCAYITYQTKSIQTKFSGIETLIDYNKDFVLVTLYNLNILLLNILKYLKSCCSFSTASGRLCTQRHPFYTSLLFNYLLSASSVIQLYSLQLEWKVSLHLFRFLLFTLCVLFVLFVTDLM